MTPKPAAAHALTRWIALTVGAFSIVGVLVGAGVNYGQHLRADAEQDARLRTLEDRVRDLERQAVYIHGMALPHAPKE